MRVLLAHKFFRPFGGIERHLFDVRDLLRQRGHEIVDFAMADPRNAPSPYAADFVSPVDMRDPSPAAVLRSLGRMLYSFEARRRIGRLADRTHPDVAHVMSVYHQLSPSVLHALHRRRIPIVHKLADYKVVCPVYTLFARGSVCERCAGGRVHWVALRRCHEGRLLPSLVLALEAALHRWALDSYGLVDLFLAPSRFLGDKVRSMGLRGRVRVLPNFVDLPRWPVVPMSEQPVVAYAGRLVPEKGVPLLVRAMESVQAELRIFGDGPERPAIERLIRERQLANVRLYGHLDEAGLRQALAECRCLVLPAIWYENNPHAVLEAFALGRPVVASDIGGLPELVIHGRTGLLVPARDVGALSSAIRALCEDRALAVRLGQGGRELVETGHTPGVFYGGLMAAYREVMG